MQAVEYALMAAATDNIVCYYCNQQGHIAANWPTKRQQRQQQNGSSRPPEQYSAVHPPRPQGYQQRQPQPQKRLYPNSGGRNVVPNRPQFQPIPGITPAPPTQNVAMTPPTYRGNPQHNQPQYPPQNPPHTAASYYSAPTMPMPVAPPYGAAPYNSIIYNNPAFQPSPYHPNPLMINNSAFISADSVDDDDYYSTDLGAHQPTSGEFDIEFGNDTFDTSAPQYCGMNTAKFNGRLSEEGEISPSKSTQPPVEHAANEFLSSKSEDGEPPTRYITRFAAQPPPAPSPASRSRTVTSPAPAATDFLAAKILAPATVFIPPLLPPITAPPAKPLLPRPSSRQRYLLQKGLQR